MARPIRYYRNADRALLWARSGGICCFPDCEVECVQEARGEDQAAIIGRIAHIEAFSDQGPRANPGLSERDRNEYENLILLCPTHHEVVDAFESIYTVEDLRRWKAERESKLSQVFTQLIGTVTFNELEMITQALAASEMLQSTSFSIVPPLEKMVRNGLSPQTQVLFNIGLAQSSQVQRYIETMNGIDRTFVARLTSGFVREYHQHRGEGLEGDSLFEQMRIFSAQGKLDLRSQCAGLAVLVYLFERCEVFEQ